MPARRSFPGGGLPPRLPAKHLGVPAEWACSRASGSCAAACAHPSSIVVWQQRRFCLCQLAELHSAQRKQVAALLPRQALEQMVCAKGLVGAVVARG